MKRIIIFGATSRIAEMCARIWAERGCSLYLVARNKKHLMEISSDLALRGASRVHIKCIDLNHIESHAEILRSAISSIGEIDEVLIAHGTLPNQKDCEVNLSLALNEIQTNAISSISLLTHISNYFEKKKTGTIAIISSIAGDKGKESNYIYGSAKSLISTFTSGLRQRLYKSGVSVVTIKPGFVETPMTKSFKKGILWSKPEKIAPRIVKAIDKKKNDVYVPYFWLFIVIFLKILPTSLFKRISL